METYSTYSHINRQIEDYIDQCISNDYKVIRAKMIVAELLTDNDVAIICEQRELNIPDTIGCGFNQKISEHVESWNLDQKIDALLNILRYINNFS